MRLGLISDVHANLPALEAVLSDMPESVDEVVCLGDVVGYNPYPVECLELVQEECDYVLQGNHDREISNPEVYRRNRQAYEGLKLAREELSDEDVQYLLELPEQTEIGDTGFLGVHSHPENVDEYVMPKDFPTVRPYLDDYDGVFLGHTHVQHEAVIDDRLILNPGSVGQSRDGNPQAGYAVVDTESLETDLRRTSYDIWKVVKEIERTGLPEATGERLLPSSAGRSRDRNNPWR